MSEIGEYVKFLENKYDSLTEARGVYDLTSQIVDTCYEYICSNLSELKLIEIEREYEYSYNVYQNDYEVPLKDNSFIVNPIIRLKLYVSSTNDIESSGRFYNPDLDDIQNDKLVNPLFVINIPTDRKDKVNYSKFSSVMTHEVHHAYRWFNINRTNPTDSNELAKIRTYEYFKNIDVNTFEDELLSFIFYITDEDEINAFSSEIYSVIKNNPIINAGNYKDYLNEFDIYKYLNKMHWYLTYLQNTQYDEFSGSYDTISFRMNEVFDTNYTPQQNRKRLISLLSNKIIIMYKQFFKVLGKAVIDFKRPIRQTEARQQFKFLEDDFERALKYAKYNVYGLKNN